MKESSTYQGILQDGRIEALQKMLTSDPYQRFRLESGAQRVVTFVRGKPRGRLRLPLELDGARILRIEDGEVFTAYVPSPRGAVFMGLIERTFGKEVTTRTWDTIRKVVERSRWSPTAMGPLPLTDGL